MGESHQGGSLRTGRGTKRGSQPTYDARPAVAVPGARRARPPFSSEGPPAPPLHRVDAARHPARARRARRHPPPRRAGVGVAAPLTAADEKGWFRFQRLYDVARSVLRTEDDVRRLVREAAEDDVADGGRWLEIQVDPSGYAARFGGITAFTDLVLDAVRDAQRAHRPRHRRGHRCQPHPPPARRPHPRPAGRSVRRPRRRRLRPLQRRAARATTDFAPAFEIAERAGLLLAPHGGELRGPEHIRTCLDDLHADRLGHGVRSAEDPDLLARIVDAGVALEVCPVSNVALGVYSDLTSVPLPELLAAGATVALGADDPLLFGSRLAGQYATMRAAHALPDETLAELARMSFRASRAPDATKQEIMAASTTGWRHLSPSAGSGGVPRSRTAAAHPPARRRPRGEPVHLTLRSGLARLPAPVQSADGGGRGWRRRREGRLGGGEGGRGGRGKRGGRGGGGGGVGARRGRGGAGGGGAGGGEPLDAAGLPAIRDGGGGGEGGGAGVRVRAEGGAGVRGGGGGRRACEGLFEDRGRGSARDGVRPAAAAAVRLRSPGAARPPRCRRAFGWVGGGVGGEVGEQTQVVALILGSLWAAPDLADRSAGSRAPGRARRRPHAPTLQEPPPGHRRLVLGIVTTSCSPWCPPVRRRRVVFVAAGS